MEVNTAKFIISNTDYKKCPPGILHEYAFIGRSNVGKSSLINMLTRRSKLAKISSSPGKTRLINHFLINKKWYLVDLPGYGYAKISKTEREKWAEMINKYLLNRKSLVCLFVLIDSRIPPQKIDIEFIEWLGNKKIPFVIIFTKTDKTSSAETNKQKESFSKELLKKWESLPEIFMTSAKTALGREDILNYIENLNNNIDISLLK